MKKTRRFNSISGQETARELKGTSRLHNGRIRQCTRHTVGRESVTGGCVPSSRVWGRVSHVVTKSTFRAGTRGPGDDDDEEEEENKQFVVVKARK